MFYNAQRRDEQEYFRHDLCEVGIEQLDEG